MNRFLACAILSITPLFAAESAAPAGLAGLLGATGLTSAQLLSGLKSGLGTALDLSTGELAKPGAFQMPVPPSMAKLESAVKKLNQTGLLDSFKASLNQSAASVAPQTTAAMKESVGALTLDDAAALTGGGSDAATKLLRKAAEPVLRAKLMPLVAQAIASNGSAAKAKELATKAGPMAAMLGVPSAGDLEGYVFTQLLDTSFAYLAKQEAALRANPGAMKDKFAALVFGAAKK